MLGAPVRAGMVLVIGRPEPLYSNMLCDWIMELQSVHNPDLDYIDAAEKLVVVARYSGARRIELLLHGVLHGLGVVDCPPRGPARQGSPAVAALCYAQCGVAEILACPS